MNDLALLCCRDKDDIQPCVFAANAFEQLHTIHPRHVHVQDYQIHLGMIRQPLHDALRIMLHPLNMKAFNPVNVLLVDLRDHGIIVNNHHPKHRDSLPLSSV